MDGTCFDRLARYLAERRPRRAASRLLGGLALGGLVVVLEPPEAEAGRRGRKRKQKKRRRRRACPSGLRRCPSNTKWSGACGRCCLDSECPGLAACVIGASGAPECVCGTGHTCDAVCIPEDCADNCYQTCNTAGSYPRAPGVAAASL